MKRILLLLLIQYCCCICSAQIKPAQQLRFNYLGVKDGLPESLVSTLLQDKEGYFWVGTQNGLVRFDGYRLKKYRFKPKDENSNNISIIYDDKKDTIWIGTYNGLYYYDRTRDTVIEQSLFNSFYNEKKYIIQFIQIDNESNIWLQIFDDEKKISCLGFLNRRTKHFTVFSNQEQGRQYIGATNFYSSFIDKQNNLWVETDNCLLKYIPANKQFKTIYFDTAHTDIYWYENEDSINHNDIWFLYKDKKSTTYKGFGRYNILTNTVKTFQHTGIEANDAFGAIAGMNFTASTKQVWFATLSGLTAFDPVKETFTDFNVNETKTGKYDNAVLWAIEDKAGSIWCWGAKGILRFNIYAGTFTRYGHNETDAQGVLSNTINHISLDQQGYPWFGVWFIGLQWLNKDQSKFIVHKSDPGYIHRFAGGTVNSFAESPDGTFWLGSDHGLYRWQPRLDSFTFIQFDKNADKNVSVNAVMLAKDGRLWFCATGGLDKFQGLYCYDPALKKTTNYRYRQNDSLSLGNNSINSIFQDDAGTIWIGLDYGGLCRFNNKTQNFTRYPFINGNKITVPKSDSLDDAAVEVIYEDKQKTLWLGTKNGGLNKFNPQTGRFTSYLDKLPGFFSITSINGDDKNNIWAGTYFGGLFLLDKATGSLKKYTEKTGLLYDGAWGINKDANNNLWITSPRGISILNAENNTVRTITPANGLLEYPAYRRLYKTSKGLFLYGCKNGFVEFNPDDFAPDTNVPVMHIETVGFYKRQKDVSKEINTNVIRYGKSKINLTYKENRLTFSFVGLLYQNTSLIKYAYKLDGYDEGWVQAGTQHTATYTNLSPGTYTFHVIAANSDGIWTSKEDSIIINISPPWWQTWWAYLLYAIVIIITVWLLIAYRSKALTRQNKILEVRVNKRTKQLNKKTEELNKSFEELKSAQAQLIQSEKMASLGELTAGIAHEIQNPLNFVNNFSEVNKELFDELEQEAVKGNVDEVIAIAKDIKENLEKIKHHSNRADAIVKGMLQHSRKSTGHKEPTNINKLADEYLRLSYHGLRAKDKSFNADFKTDFDNNIGKINIVPQDIGRVLLNLFNNAFYAVSKPSSPKGENYKPLVSVTTRKIKLANNDVAKNSPLGDEGIEIIISDNGRGIPLNIIDKIFQPFFTTKPTGQGTGLGLSLSYDIITKEHNGTIKVESKEGEGSTFIICLPVSFKAE